MWRHPAVRCPLSGRHHLGNAPDCRFFCLDSAGHRHDVGTEWRGARLLFHVKRRRTPHIGNIHWGRAPSDHRPVTVRPQCRLRVVGDARQGLIGQSPRGLLRSRSVPLAGEQSVRIRHGNRRQVPRETLLTIAGTGGPTAGRISDLRSPCRKSAVLPWSTAETSSSVHRRALTVSFSIVQAAQHKPAGLEPRAARRSSGDGWLWDGASTASVALLHPYRDERHIPTTVPSDLFHVKRKSATPRRISTANS